MNKSINKLGCYNLIGEHNCIYLAEWNNCVTFANGLSEEIGKKIEGKEFTINVCYPFHKGLSKKINLDLHCSMDCNAYVIFANKIIDVIVDMLREMYKTAEGTEYKIEGLLNQCSKSPIYGDCMHAITDLWLERLYIDLKTRTIIPHIGS